MGMYRCMGQGHTDIWGDVWGLQMYGKHTDVLDDVQMYGVHRCVGHTDTPQTYRQPDISQHACQLHLGTIFLINLSLFHIGTYC